MENDKDELVHSVQLNPQILANVRRRVLDSLECVLVDMLYTFFAKMFLKAQSDSAMNPTELNPHNVFIDRLDVISKWGEEIVNTTCDALKNHAETKFKFFDLKKSLKRILSTELCQQGALENKACSSRIQVNDVHISEFIYNLLKLSAPHVANAPTLFTPNRGAEYVRREEGLDLFLVRSIRRALSIFIELFIWRIEDGQIDSPFVAMPAAAVEGVPSEAVTFKEVGGEPGAGGDSMIGRITEAEGEEDFGAGMGAAGDEENEEEGEGGGTAPNMEFDENPSEDPRAQGKELSSSDNRPWSMDEKSRGTYSDDDMRDDERRNPRRLSFNEDVEVTEFKREAPPSILKRNNPSRIYKTKFDPDV